MVRSRHPRGRLHGLPAATTIVWLVIVAGFSGCMRKPGPAAEPAVTGGGSRPDAAGIAFDDIARASGLAHAHPPQPRPLTALDAFGCGCGLFDQDDDGRLDVFFVADPHPLLFRGAADGSFHDVTAETGLAGLTGDHWTGCAVGDENGDGRLDLLVTGFHRLALLRLGGDGRYTDVTQARGLDPGNHGRWGTSAGFMDLDGDGDHDLVILNYVVFGPDVKRYCELVPGVISGCPPREYEPEFGEVWRNDGDAGFTLVDPEVSGIAATSGIGLVLAFTDYDDDGRIDFYIGNDGTRAELMHNLGGMAFENVGETSGVAASRDFDAMSAMGADWADYDRDGRLDLAVSDFQKKGFALYHADGQGLFLEVGTRTGLALATHSRLGFGTTWLDMDNDAFPDLCFANGHVYDNVAAIEPGATFRQPVSLFRNLAGRRFVDVVPALAAAVARPLVGRGSATGDVDNDGRLDLLVVDYEGPPMLLANRSRTGHHWIELELRAALPNRFAYGARAVGRLGDAVWVGEVTPTSSYLSSSDPRIHWGLGAASRLDALEIRWPSGRRETFHDVAADAILRIEEGSGPPRRLEVAVRPADTAP